SSSLTEALKADTVFILGSKVDDENPVTDYILRRVVSNKLTTLITATPRNLRLDTQAKVTLRYLPGNEGGLLSAILDGITKEDRNGILKNSFPDSADFKKSLAGFSTETAINSIGASKEGIDNAVKELLKSKKISFFVGMDALRFPEASETIKGISNLISILESFNREIVAVHFLMDRCNQKGAWDMGVLPNLLPGYIKTDDEKGRVSLEELWGAKIPVDEGADVHKMLQGALEGKLRVLYIAGADPVTMYPDGEFVKKALSKLEMLIVQDTFHTETARYAHVVLPGTTFAEKDGAITSSEGRVQRIKKVFNPSFETRNDIEIFKEVAGTLGAELTPATSREVFNEIQKVVPAYEGIEEGGLTSGSFNGNGKGELYISEYSGVQKEENAFPYYLTTGNHLFHSGVISQEADTLKGLLHEPFVGISREDVALLDLKEGTSVRVIAENGNELILKVKVDRYLPKGIVFIPENFKESRINLLLKKDNRPPCVKVLKVTDDVA
ncbi:MAG: molybdopterin oxidoreductase family protein, partial [Thermodesulfobacteriota bacterium]